MKVTALIPEELISETRKFSGGKNITESLLIALRDYIARKRIKRAVGKLRSAPLEFKEGYSAGKIRKLNRA